MKVALVHDWLTGLRGGERCLQAFLQIYPEADIFTLLHIPGATDRMIDSRIKQSSFIQKLPASKHYYRYLLPLYPWAVSGFDFKGYDLVISLSHAAAKNITVPESVPHISYCFTPMRYIWDQARNYFGAATPLIWPLISSLRSWDCRGAERLTAIVGISKFIAARIRKFYGLEAHVIYPPVDTSWITPLSSFAKGEAFLCAGALVPYKKIDLVVEAFNYLNETLWIVGGGPEEAKLKRIAGSNIKFFGRVSDLELAKFYSASRALIFPGTEDFGMVPIECLAAGRPVIGHYSGALRESLGGMRPWKKSDLDESSASGVFIRRGFTRGDQISEIVKSVLFFKEDESRFTPQNCVSAARKFEPQRFYDGWERLLSQLRLTGSTGFQPATKYL